MLSSLFFKQLLTKHFSTLPKAGPHLSYLHSSLENIPLQPSLVTANYQPRLSAPEADPKVPQQAIYSFINERGVNNVDDQAINIGQSGLGVDSLKQTLEEDEERHGEAPRDRDTGEKLESDEDLNQEAKAEDDKKNKKEEESDDDDDEGGGGLLIPLIEWVGGLIPRLAKDPTKG